MVTFSLGGKDYGIDIMKVKEIAKFVHFTYVPNCPPFVRGVYNLRGDIISVIDLRHMFNIPVPEKPQSAAQGAGNRAESGLILRLESTLLGVVVDQIDKVVGIASSAIQPPHPIFADINIKYISGVVEHENRLYIILDVERILSREAQIETARPAITGDVDAETLTPVPEREERLETVAAPSRPKEGDVGFGFISETLATFAGFYVSPVNREWVTQRYKGWKVEHGTEASKGQLTSVDDATAFLQSFHSPATGRFWPEEYSREIEKLFPREQLRSVQVWNPGCAKGYESYSLCCLLRKHYPEARIKIWASDKDLLSISTAPNLVFPQHEVPSNCRDALVSGRNGYSFGSQIKDLIVFEYHDVLHDSGVPDVDIILARDLLSYMKPADQTALIEQFSEHLKSGGVLIVGTNERIPEEGDWRWAGDGHISAYIKI
ncbi:CheR family methyltransferase [Salinispira pacifica]